MNTLIRFVVTSAPCLLALLALGANSHAQDVLGSFEGAGGGAGFGQAVARAGDVDGDGVGDWIAGAPGDATGGSGAGAVRVVSGADGATLHEWFGAAGDALGTSVTALGDLDNDGRADLAAGAPGSHGGTTGGYVKLWSGATGAVLRTLAGQLAGGRFGQAVAGVGDVNGDARPDVAVGAPQESSATGAVYFVSGTSGTLIGQPMTGQAAGDNFGAALAFDPGMVVAAGDSDQGVVIGCTQAGNGGAGSVSLVALPDLTLVAAVSGAALGAAPGDGFGSAVAMVGDVDGDGSIDVAAGAAPSGEAASAWLLSGADGAVLGSFANAEADGGLALGAAGDVDGDGVPDLAMGEPRSDAHAQDAGTLRLWSGADGALLHVVHGPQAGARFGAALAAVGDVDGDGRQDLAVGAPVGGAGEVWLLAMRPFTDLGNGLPGVYGIPRLSGQDGAISSGAQVTLVLDDARPISGATLLLGFSTFLDAATGKLVPSPDHVVDGLVTDADGRIEVAFAWPEGVPPGTTIYYQFHVLDPLAEGGVARSNTVVGSMP